MGLFGKSKKELLEWQNMITDRPMDRLYLTEKQLQEASYLVVQNHLRIVNDCERLINTTKKPEVFFSRFESLLEIDQKLVVLSKYMKFQGRTPAEALAQATEQKPVAIRELMDRCFEDAESLKTDSARAKRYQKILHDFLPYKTQIDDPNWTYMEEKCIQGITALINQGKAGNQSRSMELIAELNRYVLQLPNTFIENYKLVVNPFYTDPAKTKSEQQPLTATGKIPKYTTHFHYETPDYGKRQLGDAWLFQDGSIGKAKLITWIDHIGYQIHLAMVNDELAITRVETSDKTISSGRWTTVFEA